MNWSKLKRKFFPQAITRRIYMWTAIVILFSHTWLSIGTFQEILSYRTHESSEQLEEAVTELNSALITKSAIIADDIVLQPGDERTNAEKLRSLQLTLQPVVDKLSREFPQLTLGYYFKELQGSLGTSQNTDDILLPYLSSARPVGGKADLFANTIKLQQGKVNILTYPIMQNGKFVGQIWAYINPGTIIYNALPRAGEELLIGILLTILVLLIQSLLFTRLSKEMGRFAGAILQGDQSFPQDVLPELAPVLQQVSATTSELRQVNKRYQTLASIVESTNDAVIGCANGVITSWNKSAEIIYGYTAVEAIGQHMTLVLPEAMVSEAMGVNFDEQGISHRESAAMRKDGSKFDVSLSVSQIKDDEGNNLGLSIIARDISEYKNMERDMSRLDRLNLVGQMAAGIGHEIRNPMTTVRGFLQLLDGKAELNGYHEYFLIMISELDRANSIISEFLSMARNKTIDLQLRDLNQTIKAIFPLIEASTMLSNKTVDLELGDIPQIWLSEKEIRQVILNLARNGLEAMQQGGKLTIATYLEGDRVTLAVKDQGSGIKPEILNKIGTPFLTTKEKGTGLGLAVCYSIASLHQAVIDIETGTTGTTFLVRFHAGNDKQ